MQEDPKLEQVDVTTLPAYIKYYLRIFPQKREPQVPVLFKPIKNYT